MCQSTRSSPACDNGQCRRSALLARQGSEGPRLPGGVGLVRLDERLVADPGERCEVGDERLAVRSAPAYLPRHQPRLDAAVGEVGVAGELACDPRARTGAPPRFWAQRPGGDA